MFRPMVRDPARQRLRPLPADLASPGLIDAVRWTLLALAGLILIVHSLAYNFVTDDAYISFVYSRNFAEHGELAFNLGDPVEGYTNFSWTVLLGLLMAIGVPPELSSRLLATACALGTLVLVFRIMERALGRKTPWAAVPPLLLACSSGFACWTSGGLETQLFTLLVTAALDAVVAAVERPRALRRAGWLLALAAMTRPEGPLIAAVFGFAYLVHLVTVLLADRRRGTPPERPFPLADQVIAAAWFLGLWAPWFAWRWWYYGYPFPNTYYVKAAGDWTDPKMASEMVQHGYYYIWVWLRQTHVFDVLALVGIGIVTTFLKPRAPRFVLGLAAALLALFYVPYAISVGGDFMGLHRFLMPLFVVAAIAVVLGVEWCLSWVAVERANTGALVVGSVLLLAVAAYAIGSRGELAALRIPPMIVLGTLVLAGVVAVLLGRRTPTRGVLAILGAILLVGAFADTQLALTRRSLDPKNLKADRGIIDTPAFLIVYTEDRAKIGRAMEACFKPDDFSIVGGAGAQPYYARMRGIDVFGLVSDRIAHESPRSRARAGHTKWGSEQLLAGYDPDFVFSCYDLQRTAAQPQLPCAGFWKARGFEEVTMYIPGLVERGEYYTFLAKKARNFQCPGRVH